MRQVVSVVTGGGPCSKDCPYYAEEGWVRGANGVPLKTHCRGTMQDIIVNCDKFNTQTIEKMEVTDDQWKTMQKAVHKRAKKERKPYDPNHDEIHPVGWSWQHQDKWNANKSNINNNGK